MTIAKTPLTAEDYSYHLPDHWLLKHDTSLFPIRHDAYVARVVDLIRASGVQSVIEIGCGDGWNCGQLAAVGLRVVGTDWSKNGIEHARRMVPQGRFYCGDITDPAFLTAFPEPFDAAIMVEVIEHIVPEECAETLRRISRLIKPGGWFVLTTPSTNTPNTNPQHYRHFTQPMLRELLGRVGGLEIQSIEGYGDTRAERRYYRLARWVQNRYYSVHPARRWLQERYRRRCLQPSLETCEGWIVSMRRSL